MTDQLRTNKALHPTAYSFAPFARASLRSLRFRRRVSLAFCCRAQLDRCRHFREYKSMPAEYECEECRLTFVSGWCLTGKRHPGGLEFLVCKECGTQHKVESSPKAGTRFRVVAQPEPLTFFKSRTEIEDALELNANHQDWIELFVVEEIPEPNSDTDSSELRFEDITCPHFCAKGNVISKMSDEDNCPRCKNNTLRYVMSWIT